MPVIETNSVKTAAVLLMEVGSFQSLSGPDDRGRCTFKVEVPEASLPQANGIIEKCARRVDWIGHIGEYEAQLKRLHGLLAQALGWPENGKTGQSKHRRSQT
jgi:hypothetical protein